jgi:Dolichyl-phosphate-mannose-protein mannosyltransferase
VTRTFRSLHPGILLAVLLIGAVAAIADTYRALSHTWDEPSHLAAGLALLDKGQYYFEHQHPPVARLAMAVGPFLAGERAEDPPTFLPLGRFFPRMIQGFDEGRRILYHAGAYDRVLTLARVGIVPFLLVAVLATFFWSRRLFGAWPALAAALFLVTTPPFLGNAGIATLDLPLAAMVVVTLAVFCRWLDRPGTLAALILGAAAGAAVMTKFSAIPFLGVSVIAIVAWFAWVRWREQPRRRPLTMAHVRTAVPVVVAFAVVCWVSYGGGFVSAVDPADQPYEAVARVFGRDTMLYGLVSWILELPLIPYFAWELKLGLGDLNYHNQLGHLSYFMGEVGMTGWWQFYLVGLGVRTPLPVLLAGVVGLALLWRASARTANWQLAAPALSFVAVLVFVSVYSRINLGIRHVLVLYPLLAIGAAYTVARLLSVRRLRPLATALAAALVISQVYSSVSAHPDHLTYFNVLAEPAPERFLIAADLDWGQDMKRLEAELRARNIDKIALAYYGSNDLSRHALGDYSKLPPKTVVDGWIAVSLWRLYLDPDYAWLKEHTPVARVGRSINLYHLEEASKP